MAEAWVAGILGEAPKGDETGGMWADGTSAEALNGDKKEAGMPGAAGMFIKALKRNGMPYAWAAGMWVEEGLRGGPTWSSAPSSSVLMMSSICVEDWIEELPGSKAWVPQDWVPGINSCIW